MILRRTQSLCPVCLRRIDATYGDSPERPGSIVLRKTCPEHGAFSVPAWILPPDAASQSPISFEAWRNDKCPSYPAVPQTGIKSGCPFDCGLCPTHAQRTCCALVEVTRRCNLNCPVCYAAADASDVKTDPSLADVARMLDSLKAAAGRCNVQISGGEPTVRDDLPEIAALARRRDFALVQLNTNGLRLGREDGYAARLRSAGVDCVYLQYDGVSPAVIKALRGASGIMEEKRRAIRLCEAAGLGVVLVSTLARGVNDGEIGDMLRFALEQGTVVRGVHFQPVSSFGRFPWNLEDAPRLTLPEVMLRLEEQAPELVQVSHFNPPGGEHALCSFNAVYTRLPATWGDRDGLALLPGGGQRNDCCCPPPLAADGANKARDFVSRHWKGGKADTTSHTPMDDFAAFVAHSSLERHFTISAMAFQDALSLDLERIRGCFIHVMRPDGRLVPFCLHNLTSSDGTRLHA